MAYVVSCHDYVLVSQFTLTLKMEIMHRRLVVPPLFDLTPQRRILHEICQGGRGAEKGLGYDRGSVDGKLL